ncbi:MAG: siphovirus Gp157 family protein, partial [Ruminococcus bromii]|nr:siphovirus Gp157 family protein [Ruminococcus bromii]
KKKSIENNIDSLRRRLGAFLVSMNTKSYAAGTFTVKRRETQQVIIDDSEKIPAEFMKTRVSETPNKTLIKESIKAGKEIAGAHLQTNQSITIK